MQKRFALLTAAALLAAAAPAAAAPSFSDMTDHWARASVEAAAAAGYAAGYPDGTFRPDSNITRAEFFKLLSAAMRQPQAPGLTTGFQREDHWAFNQGYVQGAVRAGLLEPTDYGGSFNPDSLITRREIVMAAIRALGLEPVLYDAEIPLNAADADTYPTWLQPWAALALERGLLTGYPDGALHLGEPATRAEALTIIQRLLPGIAAEVAPAEAPPQAAARYPAEGEPTWQVADPSTTPYTVTDGTESYTLPDSARAVILVPAPGGACWVAYTMDDADTGEIIDVIARLQGGQLTPVFQEPAHARRHVLTGDDQGRLWFSDGASLKRATAQGQVESVAGVQEPLFLGMVDKQDTFWGVGESHTLWQVDAAGKAASIATGADIQDVVVAVAPAGDGSIWLLVYRGQTEELESWLVAEGQVVHQNRLLSSYVTRPDAMAPQAVGLAGDDLWIARITQTGPVDWAQTGFFAFDLTDGTIRPLVLPAPVDQPVRMIASPEGTPIVEDASGRFWQILPQE